jgi:predicted nuclease of predicted toxin-antitoxin system
MISTNINVKALPERSSIQVQEPEIKTCKIMLDECVTLRTYSIQNLGDYEFYHSAAVVGYGASDIQVAKSAIRKKCLLVTADRRFLKKYAGTGMPAAWFNHYTGDVYILQKIMQLPIIQNGGAPIKQRTVEIVVKPSANRSIWVKLTRLFK